MKIFTNESYFNVANEEEQKASRLKKIYLKKICYTSSCSFPFAERNVNFFCYITYNHEK